MIDPDEAERRDQRMGNWIVVLAYGGPLIIGLIGLTVWLAR